MSCPVLYCTNDSIGLAPMPYRRLRLDTFMVSHRADSWFGVHMSRYDLKDVDIVPPSTDAI
ncbi:hypothetical protein AGR1B_pAt30446 [Agrobacterium fabacearum S56]|nr:hypothetical protein AGR1B_pAt30446 [Agrobacterium fabacearum S56]